MRLLMGELDRQNRELDKLRSSVHQESNSRLLAEEALDETRDRLQLAVEAAGLALWDWQLRSPQVFLNSRWGEMVGDVASEGYWDSVGLLERVHPDDRTRVESEARRLLSGQVQRAVSQYRVRTGEDWLWIESHGMVAEHDAQGRPIRLMGTHADISERKRIEQAGERAREVAEQASQAKSEFLANISHEVRTPLNALMGLTRMLLDSSLTAEQRNWLDLMDTSAHSLLSMLNDVLDLSRIEAGKLMIDSVKMPLRETLEDICAIYAEQARAKPLQWQLQLPDDLPAQVMGDPGRWRQVLGNLLSNALKFTPKGGQIQVSAQVLAPEAPGQRRRLQLQVADTGIGIAAKHQATIFDAFTQADASTARRYGGSGLGLAICARLVKLMGGRIDLLSELGHGSRFVITMPLHEAAVVDSVPLSAPMELHEIQQAGKRFGGLRVLVAEDHPVNELIMGQLLRRLGCTVQSARDGAMAITEWEKGQVDLVMMDVQMPGTSGLEATRRIRELEIRLGRPHTPIIAVTANAMNGDREACLLAGMDGYIPKPVSPQELIQAIDDALLKVAGRPTARRAPNLAVPSEAPTRSTATVGPVNLDKLRRRLDGDEATLRQLAQVMRGDLQARLHELQQALQARDADMAIAHAHGLKGSLGSMTAERGARLAKGLELAARSRDWHLFERALPLMQAEADKIDAALSVVVSPLPDA